MKKIKRQIPVFLMLFLMSAPVYAGDFQDGYDAYKQKDYKTALDKWKPLAEQGDAHAQYNLGQMYREGQGVLQDWAEVLKWFRLSAEQGDAKGQHALGVMYDNGQGVTQDYIQAHKWYNIAGANGYERASKYRNLIEKQMTPYQIAEAQRLAKAWMNDSRGPKPSSISGEKSSGKSIQLTGSGTGFVVNKEGYVLTNFHVIKGCRVIKVKGRGALGFVAQDSENDLALLKTKLPKDNIAVFRSDSLKLGEQILTAGYPLKGLLGSQINVTEGIISSTVGLGNDSRFVQITAPVQPGNSGGPLVDQSGNVLGIVTAKLDAMKVAEATGDIPQNVNFALRAGIAKMFMDANNVKYLTSVSDKKQEISEIAELVSKFTFSLECWK